MSSKKILILLASVIIVIAALAMVAGAPRDTGEHGRGNKAAGSNTSPSTAATGKDFSVNNLRLPFKIDDISQSRGEINPIGVVRFSKDRADVGHSGLDVPLSQRAPIYAVADGEIVRIKSAGDPWGGMGVYQLVQPTVSGEGWGYIYEHITPADGVRVGSAVKAGDTVGYKTAPIDFTAHFQLSYLFNDYEFTRDTVCWVDYLNAADSQTLQSWWQEYRASSHLVNAWRTNSEEGKFPFWGLLNTERFPNGPQLCYPPGTDVREDFQGS